MIKVEIVHANYITELKKRERKQRDIEIIKANAKRFKKEAKENLKFQAEIWKLNAANFLAALLR